MGHIVVEFYAPSANARARIWKEEMIKAITAAILNIKNNGVKIFTEEDVTVYFTFEEKIRTSFSEKSP